MNTAVMSSHGLFTLVLSSRGKAWLVRSAPGWVRLGSAVTEAHGLSGLGSACLVRSGPVTSRQSRIAVARRVLTRLRPSGLGSLVQACLVWLHRPRLIRSRQSTLVMPPHGSPSPGLPRQSRIVELGHVDSRQRSSRRVTSGLGSRVASCRVLTSPAPSSLGSHGKSRHVDSWLGVPCLVLARQSSHVTSTRPQSRPVGPRLASRLTEVSSSRVTPRLGNPSLKRAARHF